MKKLGFTLAEVLITLVIIGVIAAMTVPTLMNNTNAQEFRSALKKAVSGVNQALTLHYALEGLGAQDYSDENQIITELFEKRMNIVDGAYTANYVLQDPDGDTGCTPSNADGSKTAFTTQDGIIFCLNNWAVSDGDDATGQGGVCNSYNTTPCSTDGTAINLFIDVNGEKNPNRATKNSAQPRDQYWAHIYNQKVVPYGNPTQEVMFDKQVSTVAAGG